MDEKTLRDTKIKVADSFQEGAHSIYKVLAPHWNSRTDALKTLISVSSGSIVLTVTFASAIKSLNAGPSWRYLALFSFVMFALSVMSGLAAVWIGIGLHGFESDILNNRAELQDTVDRVNPRSKDLTEPFTPVINRLLEPIALRDKWADRLSKVSFVCFGLAVTALTIIGFKQVL